MNENTENSKIQYRLLLSRLFTRSGDQAWDFAVPIVFLLVFPRQFNIAASYYLFVRLGQVFLTPHLTSFIDRTNRLKAARMGIGLQVISIVFELFMILFLVKILPQGYFIWEFKTILVFLALIMAGIGSSLGATFMNIAVANDIVPSLFTELELAKFNSRLKQVDLFTEVSSPVLAGLILLIRPETFPLLGFIIIVFWNILSFIPEYRLLLTVFRIRPDLLKTKLSLSNASKKTFMQNLLGGWRSFFRQPVAAASICYAILWLSVLSPHGILLTAFLKGGWHLSEPLIGLFRGLGALFGLTSTFLFLKVLKKSNLMSAGRAFLQFQSLMVLAALICFYLDFKMGFLIFILFSRIGLYGFSLGETQIRQEGIPENLRGEINGFASSLTSIATLFLYASGTLLPSVESFHILVDMSVAFVCLSAFVFTIWSVKKGKFL